MEKMVSPKKTALQRGVGLFLLFGWLVVVVAVGSWRGGGLVFFESYNPCTKSLSH